MKYNLFISLYMKINSIIKMPQTGLILVLLCIIFLSVNGCSTSNQIFKYESRINTLNQNLIPGIEPEESANKIMITVKGKGIAPENGTPMQKKFLAERAAVIDGYRQLTERLSGILVNYYAETGKNTVSTDQVLIESKAYLRGAQVYGLSYQDGFAIANVRVFLEPRQSKFYSSIPAKFLK